LHSVSGCDLILLRIFEAEKECCHKNTEAEQEKTTKKQKQKTTKNG